MKMSVAPVTIDDGVENKAPTVPQFGANGVALMWNEENIHQADWVKARKLLDRGTDVCGCEGGDLGEEPHLELERFVGPEAKVGSEESVRVPGIEHLVQNG